MRLLKRKKTERAKLRQTSFPERGRGPWGKRQKNVEGGLACAAHYHQEQHQGEKDVGHGRIEDNADHRC